MILYSAVMFVGSIVYYLLVKKVQKLGVEKNLYMLINSIVPIFLFLALSLLNTGTLQLSFKGYLIAIFTAMILNYIGSVAGFMGIKKAPNSGYSVIIQKVMQYILPFCQYYYSTPNLSLTKLLA